MRERERERQGRRDANHVRMSELVTDMGNWGSIPPGIL